MGSLTTFLTRKKSTLPLVGIKAEELTENMVQVCDLARRSEDSF